MEKVKALRLVPVPTLSRVVIQEYAVTTMEHLWEQLVIRERMMQERALLPKFAIKEYFSQILGLWPRMWMSLSVVTSRKWSQIPQ